MDSVLQNLESRSMSIRPSASDLTLVCGTWTLLCYFVPVVPVASIKACSAAAAAIEYGGGASSNIPP
jgi:hypothetical protein